MTDLTKHETAGPPRFVPGKGPPALSGRSGADKDINFDNLFSFRFWWGPALSGAILASPFALISQNAEFIASVVLTLLIAIVMLVINEGMDDYRCRACKKRLKTGAKLCPHCQTATSPAK